MSDNSILVILGRKGSGKTTLVREIIDEHPRVFVIDSLAEYPYRVFEGKHASIEGMLSVKDKSRFKLSLRVLDREENLELIDLAYDFPKTLIVVEETSLYTRPNYLPKPIEQLVRYGRHREIDQIYVARRPSEISRDLTAQADLIISFEQREPRDIKYLRDVAGEEAERVSSLPKYKVMAFGDLEKMPLAASQRLHRQGEKQLDAFKEGS